MKGQLAALILMMILLTGKGSGDCLENHSYIVR